MDQETKNCLQCGQPMQAGRSTKKYCSDTCKQAAFYSRNGQHGITLNGNEWFNVNSDCKVHTNTTNEDLEKTPEFKQPVSSNQPFNGTGEVTKSEGYNGNAHRDQFHTLSIFSQKPKTEQQQVDLEADDKDNQQPLPFNVKNSVKQQENSDADDEQLPFKVRNNVKRQPSQVVNPNYNAEEEEPYQYVRSELIDAIGDFVIDNYRTAGMFQNPEKYWYKWDLEKVKWISVRFRCIIENLLRNENSVMERKTMVALSDALKSMINATNFLYRPHNYPLTSELLELQKSTERIATSGDKTFRFQLRKANKVKLVALRFMLADLVPFIRFYDLNFSK